MTKIKLFGENVTYKEVSTTKTYFVNDKIVKMYCYIKQDNVTDDYETDSDIDMDDYNKLTDKEREDFDDFIEGEEQ